MAVSVLRDICFDCADARVVARFWSEVLGYTMAPFDPADPEADIPISPQEPGSGMRIWFNKVPEAKVAKNRVHIDINMPDDAEMARLQSLGARVINEIHDDNGDLIWTIMADPEGNEFCAFPPKRS